MSEKKSFGQALPKEPLSIQRLDGDIIEIAGVRYSGDLFRFWGGGPPFSSDRLVFRIVKREDGVVTVHTIQLTDEDFLRLVK